MNTKSYMSYIEVLKCCPKFKNQYLKWHFYKNIPIKMNKNNHYYKIKN